MLGGFRAYSDDATVKGVFSTGTGIKKLFNNAAAGVVRARTPRPVSRSTIFETLGPINILKLKYVPQRLPARLVAELWF